MADDDTLYALAKRVRRITITSHPTERDTRTLADALGVALEDLAALRAELAADREAERKFIDSIGVRVLGDDYGTKQSTADWYKANAWTGQEPPSRLKHGPGGTGLAGPCDPDCAKCAAEGGIKVVSAPRPTDDGPEAWRADIRAALPESQRTHFDRGDFVECATCCTKRGMPTLCAHCLANRHTVGRLRAEVAEYKEHVREAYQERDKLRAALASAIRYAREYHAAAFGGDCDPAELAHLAELEKLL